MCQQGVASEASQAVFLVCVALLRFSGSALVAQRSQEVGVVRKPSFTEQLHTAQSDVSHQSSQTVVWASWVFALLLEATPVLATKYKC